MFDVAGWFSKLSVTLALHTWQRQLSFPCASLMLQTKPSVHPGAKHIQSLHELGPGDPCLSLVCSSRVIWSAMAFFFVATYTKSISNFLISAISNASLTQIISHTPHWALWYNPVSRTDDKFNEWGSISWVKCICVSIRQKDDCTIRRWLIQLLFQKTIQS